jgi:hypothetical protein
MASRAERACIPARYVGLGAQEALEAAIRRFFELYDRLRGKRKGKPRRPTNHLHAGRLRDRLPGQAKPVDADGRVTARVAPNARAETPPLAATPPRRLQTSMGRRPPIGAGRAPPCPESVGMRSVPQRRRRNLAQSLRGVRRPPFHPRRRLRRCRPAFASPRCADRTRRLALARAPNMPGSRGNAAIPEERQEPARQIPLDGLSGARRFMLAGSCLRFAWPVA